MGRGLPPLPGLTRAALLVAALVVAAYALTARGADTSGVWRTEVGFEGMVSPGSATTHAVEVALPATFDQSGLEVGPQRVVLALIPTSPPGSPPFVVELIGPHGTLLEAVLDPTNPQSLPHGPPNAHIVTGRYEIRVTPLGNNTTAYALEAQLTSPFRAARDPVLVPPWAGAVAGVVLAGLALLPPPRRPKGFHADAPSTVEAVAAERP